MSISVVWREAELRLTQTGHEGEHVAERVAGMWRNLPVKAVANGEPTYENSGWIGKATGWWQGHEAWSNLCAGGTMGVVYGAGTLWQWRLHADEPGQPLPYRIVDPRDGTVVATGKRDTPRDPIPDPGGAPRVYICLADL
jgi:uncharacterized protein DUF4038